MSQSIFKLIIAAKQPLTLGEMGAAISVVPGETTWDASKQVNDMRKTLQCCGSLVSIDEERLTIHFVHHSVKQHLTLDRGSEANMHDPYDVFSGRHIVSIEEADHRLGAICVTYPNFSVFDRQVAKAEDHRARMIDYPSAILNGTLPSSHVTTKLALRFLKARGKSKHDVSQSLAEVASHTEGSIRGQEQNVFLQYALEYWLAHARNSGNKELLGFLFEKLALGAVPLVICPWAPETLSSPGQAVVEFICRHDHFQLFNYVMCSLPFYSNNVFFNLLFQRMFQAKRYNLLASSPIDIFKHHPFLVFPTTASRRVSLLSTFFPSENTFPFRMTPRDLRQYGFDMVPLYYKTEHHFLEVVESKKPWDIFSLAAATGDEEIVEMFLDAVLDAYLFGKHAVNVGFAAAAFREAACRRFHEIMIKIYAYFDEIYGTYLGEFNLRRDEYDWIPPFYAAAAKHQILIDQMLVFKRADVFAFKNRDGLNLASIMSMAGCPPSQITEWKVGPISTTSILSSKKVSLLFNYPLLVYLLKMGLKVIKAAHSYFGNCPDTLVFSQGEWLHVVG